MSRMPEQHLQEVLAQLPWLERSCLLLSLNTDFTQQEIARILNVTEEEVRAATLRGREQFHHSYDHIGKAKEAQTERTVHKESNVADIPLLGMAKK